MASSISLGRRLGCGPRGPGRRSRSPCEPKVWEVSADFVELLAGVSHDLAGLGYVVKFGGEFEQAELAPGDFAFSGHVGVSVWFWWYKTHTRTTCPLSALAASECQVITVTAHNVKGLLHLPLGEVSTAG